MAMKEITKVVCGRFEFTKEDLMKLDEASLRGILHERVHHNIETPIYPILLKWKGEPIDGFGMQTQIVFDAWREKGYSEDDEDIRWAKRFVDYAAQIRAGEKPDIPELNEAMPEPFTDEEMKVVRKLIWGRRSGRGCWSDRYVSDEIIEKICEAGRAAPCGCNLDEVRFIVIRAPEEQRMMRGNISIENSVKIVICYDNRPVHVIGQDLPDSVPQNRGYDCAVAAVQMLLMAHALGLSGVWLSKTNASAQAFREQWGLPDNYDVALHLAIGWPAMGSIKSARVPLEYMMLRKNT